MNAKKILTMVLSVFVAGSVGYMILKETSNARIIDPDNTNASGISGADERTDPDRTSIMAYYFHGNVRCATCMKIEAYTAESITTSFTNELSAGLIEWNIVNTDEPENEHFVKDYAERKYVAALVNIFFFTPCLFRRHIIWRAFYASA